VEHRLHSFFFGFPPTTFSNALPFESTVRTSRTAASASQWEWAPHNKRKGHVRIKGKTQGLFQRQYPHFAISHDLLCSD
jgi:hypothetical protein